MHPSRTELAAGAAAAARPGHYVLFLSMVAAISGFLFGFDTAVINGVLLLLRREFSLSNLDTELAASALLLGCILGAAGASLVGDRIGRRRSLLIAAVLFTVSTAAAALAGSIELLSFGRLLGGLAIGLASVLTPVYIAEVSPADRRGTLVSLNQLAIVVGILAAYLVNWSLSALGASSWRWMIGAAALPSLAFLVGLLLIPESPRWLIARGRLEAGRAVLERIAGAGEAEREVEAVERAIAAERGSWSELLAPSMGRPLLIAVALAVFSQVTGINTVLYYGSILISENFPGSSVGQALAANVIIGVTNLAGTLVSMRLIDRWGRRAMLLTGSAGMALSLLLFIALYLIPAAPPAAALLGILGYTAFFALAMGPITWVLISEIFPNRIRGRAAAVATTALWTGTLVVTFTFLSLVHALGVPGTFAIYAALSLACFLFVQKMVPETRGRTLEEIERQWR